MSAKTKTILHVEDLGRLDGVRDEIVNFLLARGLEYYQALGILEDAKQEFMALAYGLGGEEDEEEED